jgi:perosamine synthetase
MSSDLVRNTIVHWSSFFKNQEHIRAKLLSSLYFCYEDKEFCLVPVTRNDLNDLEIIESISTWREKNQFAFPTRFPVTIEGTRTWLEKGVLDNPLRIMFLILDHRVRIIGHIGFVYNSQRCDVELDNFVRGSDRYPGVMSRALERLEQWVQEELSVEFLSLQVLASNLHAVHFYLRNGYVEVARYPMSWEQDATNSGIHLVRDEEQGEVYMIEMRKVLIGGEIPPKVLTAGPSISVQEIVLTERAVRQGWNSQHSTFIDEFEQKFAEYVGAKFAIATSSGTGALHLALNALGIGPGDEVLVPDITWVATASAVLYTGAKPIFVDVDPHDWTIDLSDLENKVSHRTKAIIPVHLYGFPARMSGVVKFAKSHGIQVVEDAAPAIGAEIEGRKVGTFGAFGCFSFQGAKLLVTGEGGMLVTNDSKLYEIARKDQDHGRMPGTFWIESLGHKYKMNNVTAALGIGQLNRVENQIYRKKRIFSWYYENLNDLDQIQFQQPHKGSNSIFWMTSIRLTESAAVSREQLMDELRMAGIDTRPVFPAISQYPIWGYAAKPQAIASVIGSSGINLPSGVLQNRSTIDYVSSIIRSAVTR